mmetsp:Transcript_1526/g.5195  ORF Transcript_1526/g.5195 Transcript_1526/m.5195 type:complete len:162 (-) Transcript_1526:97-582(-)
MAAGAPVPDERHDSEDETSCGAVAWRRRKLRGFRTCCGGEGNDKGELVNWKALERSAEAIGAVLRSGLGVFGRPLPRCRDAPAEEMGGAEERERELPPDVHAFLVKTGGSRASLLAPGTYTAGSDDEDPPTSIPAAAHWKERMECPRISVTVPSAGRSAYS